MYRYLTTSNVHHNTSFNRRYEMMINTTQMILKSMKSIFQKVKFGKMICKLLNNFYFSHENLFRLKIKVI